MTDHEIYETEPQEAFDRYLSDREDEVSEATYNAHKYRLSHFIRWCEQEGIENMNDLNGRALQDYRYWRKQDGDLNNVTMHTQMTTFRVFIKWAEDFNAVTPRLHEKVRIPNMERNEDVSDRSLEPERALKILEYLDKYHYASEKHTMFRLMFRAGVRIGGLRALDLSGYHSEDQYIEVFHKPDSDTPLKNGVQGERPIYLNSKTCQVVDDYIKTFRTELTDDYGRKPLFTTARGRMSATIIRNNVYQMTKPCYYTNECPHNKQINKCEWNNYNDASQCPSSEPPHSIRKASITYWRSRDTPAPQVGERANVSMDVIEAHYDKRTEMYKMGQRKDYFDRE